MSFRCVARLDDVELENYRSVWARRQAVELNPEAFTKEETAEIILDLYRTMGRISENHPEIPHTEYGEFQVSPDSGYVFANEDYEV